MSKAPLLILIFCLAASCSVALQTASNNDPAADEESAMARERLCEPVADGLDEEATLSDRVGRYHLVLVADSGGIARRTVSGQLTLRRLTLDPEPSRDTATPLYGYTDLDPRSVGAHRVGDPGSKDSAAPGVLVLERTEYGRRGITLRMGSDANRKDLVRYDGAYTVLRVHRIDEDGFAGSWRSGGGLDLSVTTGYFCAWKVR